VGGGSDSRAKRGSEGAEPPAAFCRRHNARVPRAVAEATRPPPGGVAAKGGHDVQVREAHSCGGERSEGAGGAPLTEGERWLQLGAPRPRAADEWTERISVQARRVAGGSECVATTEPDILDQRPCGCALERLNVA
jgi:hypothetical protein